MQVENYIKRIKSIKLTLMEILMETLKTYQFYVNGVGDKFREVQRIIKSNQYGPVTMIEQDSGHQVRCIPRVQMGTFNKEIGFLCGLNFLALDIFCGEYLQSSLNLM